jgi:hypothetical protein
MSLQDLHMEGGTDGTLASTDQKFFNCQPGKGIFYPLDNLQPDEGSSNYCKYIPHAWNMSFEGFILAVLPCILHLLIQFILLIRLLQSLRNLLQYNFKSNFSSDNCEHHGLTL